MRARAPTSTRRRSNAHSRSERGAMRRPTPGELHPPLQGEGRTAEGSPGWGDGLGVDDGAAMYAEAPSPPPGPLTPADLPPAAPPPHPPPLAGEGREGEG